MRRRTFLSGLGGVSLGGFGGSGSEGSRGTGGSPPADHETDTSGDSEPGEGGGPDRQRTLLVLLGTLVAFGGLALLAAKIRAAEPPSAETPQVTDSLERRDLMEGGEASNTLEEIIRIGNMPRTYAWLVLGSLVGAAALALVGRWNLTPLLLYGAALFGLMAFLRYGWPLVEGFFDRAEPSDLPRNSLQFGGFSTDVKVLLTLFVLISLLTAFLIALEAWFL